MRTGIGIVLIAAFALAEAAHAQIPRTRTGAPDLQGLWDADFLTPLERPKEAKTLVIPKEDAASLVKKMTPDPGKVFDPDFNYYFPNTLLEVDGTLRSSWLVQPADGQLPLTALGKLARDHGGELSDTAFDNPEERPTNERCLSGLGHPPLHAIGFVIPSSIVQTADAVLITTEDTDSTRIVHLTGPAPPSALRSRLGYSAGRWEGDTLVVETTHMAAADPAGALYRDAVVVGEGSRIIERFTLKSKDELLYQFTVEDTSLYSQPWLAEYVLKRIGGSVFEYACHEGNRSLPSMLRAGRLGRQKPPEKNSDKKPDTPAAKPADGK